jgi:putative transposase
MSGSLVGRAWLSNRRIGDFGRARAKALKDRMDSKLSPRRRRGMPKFKSKHRSVPTLNYSLRGFVLDARVVKLAGGIVVRPVWPRELPAAPSSVRIYQDALGRWWCSFVVAPHQPEPLPATGRCIGTDWGVTDVATTTSDDHDLPHRQHGRTAAARLGRYQRMMARRKPAKGAAASRGYKIAKRAAAVTRDFDAIAVEDFRPQVSGEVIDGTQGR